MRTQKANAGVRYSMTHSGITLAKDIQRAVSAIQNAKALFITAGAGMGVDSGLPDFRGPKGFWVAFPQLKMLGLELSEMSNPSRFDSDPRLVWGFFGHRYNLYSQTKPHKGFDILLKWGKAMHHGYFVFTSNVDGQFQKAGFDSDHIVECHGSIHFLQCQNPHLDGTVWPVADGTVYDVDMEKLQLRDSLPLGPPDKNNQLARPNILMFEDFTWLSDRTSDQRQRFKAFQRQLQTKNVPSVVIEIGAGHAISTVRDMSEVLASSNSTLIRINPLEPDVPEGHHVSLCMKGLEALQCIDEALNRRNANL